MDKSSGNSSTSELKRGLQVDSESNLTYNDAINGVKLESLLSARLEYTGQVSGKQYIWNKAGSIVLVDVEDSVILLAKHIGNEMCCGNSRDINKIFQVAV